MMIRRHIWIWIVCLALPVFCLSACFLFGGKESETIQGQFTQEAGSAPAVSQNTSTDFADNSQKDLQAEQTTPEQPIDNNKQEDTADAKVVVKDVELPEIEIPIANDNEQDDKSNDPEPLAAPYEPSVSTAPQLEPKPSSEAEPGNGGIVIDHNGDIMLPEVP